MQEASVTRLFDDEGGSDSGSTPDWEIEPIPSEVVGRRYVLHQRLGAGGMGTVYRATDRLTGETVALKRVAASLARGTEGGAHRLALSREFQTLASLRHPNVISVLDYGFDRTRQPYFTMPLLEEAVTLREAGWNQPLAKKVDLLIQVLQALVYLHRRGIIHRDLKPDNALVTPDGQVHVLDFGLALARDKGVIDQHGGTLRYMAPEVLQGEPPDEASDLYAVGIMAYELLALSHPFEGATPQDLINNTMTREPDLTRLDLLTSGDLRRALRQKLIDSAAGGAHDGDNDTIVGDEFVNADATTMLLPPDDETEDQQPTQFFDRADITQTVEIYYSTPDGEPITNPFVTIVRRLLTKRAWSRYHDAQQVIADLRAAMGETPSPESTEIRESFLQAARFVGRDAEVEQLTQALDEALHGRGSVWLVGGESGVGKSRLVDEVGTLAMVQGALVLRGQAVSEGGLPYQLWREPLRRLVLNVDLADPDAAVLKQIVPDIDRLLDRPIPDAPALDASAAQRRLLTTVLGMVQAYCAVYSGGALILLEDLQWSAQGLEVIRLLQPIVPQLPLLILGTYRVEEAPDLPSRLPGADVMELTRLSEASVVELSASMLGEAGRQPRVIDLLQKETEGNVFFLIEIARALAEDAGELARIGARALPEHVAAGGIQTVLQRRLDHVPQKYRPLLELAAIAGRQVDLNLLERVAGRVSLDDWLTACANAAVMNVQDGRWRFAHDKLREQMLLDLSDEKRRAMHRKIAGAMEQVYADTLHQHAPMLAYQWAHGGSVRKEFHYTRLAGKQAMEISGFADAQGFFERALALVQAGEVTGTTADQVDLQIRLGEVHQALSRYDAATRYFESALVLAREIDSRRQIAQALLGIGWVYLRQGSLDAARQKSTEALFNAESDPQMQVEAFYLTGLTYLLEGLYRPARQYLSECLPLSRDLPDRTHLANALNAIGAVFEGLADYTQAQTYLTEALELARSIGNRFLMANAQGNLGRVAYHQARYDEAQAHFDQALHLFREIGNVHGEANALYFLGFIQIATDNDPFALPYLHESLRLSRKIGAVTVTLVALCGVARLLAKRGEKEYAVELLGMILNHAASAADVDVEKEGVPSLNMLANELPLEQFEAALERGMERDLDAAVTQILDLKRATEP